MIVRSAKKAVSGLRHAWLRRRCGGLGRDAWVARQARIEVPAGIRLGAAARIEAGAILRANTSDERGIRVGEGASVKEYALLNANEGWIGLGDRSWLGPHCLVYGNGGVSIGDDVLIAAHTTISTVSHVAARTDVPINDQGIDCAPIVIEDDVWIGLNVTILKGVTIGSGAIVGAGAVVTRDVPAGSIAMGVPARVVGRRGAADGPMRAVPAGGRAA